MTVLSLADRVLAASAASAREFKMTHHIARNQERYFLAALKKEDHILQAPVPPEGECSISQAETWQEIATSRQQPHRGKALVCLTEEQILELERLPIYAQLMEWMFRPLPPKV